MLRWSVLQSAGFVGFMTPFRPTAFACSSVSITDGSHHQRNIKTPLKANRLASDTLNIDPRVAAEIFRTEKFSMHRMHWFTIERYSSYNPTHKAKHRRAFATTRSTSIYHI